MLCGDAWGVAGFSTRTGYFGTEWFDGALYMMGGPAAKQVVMCLWFVYVATLVFVGLTIINQVTNRADEAGN